MKVLRILVIAFILTLISGLYVVRPLVLDAIIVYLGFPFHWLIAHRGYFGYPPGPLKFDVSWGWFIVDFAIYGLLAATAMGIYEKTLKHVSKPKIYRFLSELSYVYLVICCWAIIFWTLFRETMPLFVNLIWLRDIYSSVEGWLRFLLGVMTIIFTWFLIKHFKQASTPLRKRRFDTE